MRGSEYGACAVMKCAGIELGATPGTLIELGGCEYGPKPGGAVWYDCEIA